MIKSASRPARLLSDEHAISQEMRAARYLYHRLLDFEDTHQRVIEDAAEQCAPGIGRVARIVARLLKREKRRERSTGWSPNPHPEWLSSLRERLDELRKKRNDDPRWKVAIKWGDESEPDAPERGRPRRKRGESDTEYAARCATRRSRLSRREQHRARIYAEHVGKSATELSRVYWGTWNGLIRAVDQARSSVLKARREGLPAEWRRPRWDDPTTLYADSGGFRVVDYGGGTIAANHGSLVGNPWWTVEMRIADGQWCRVKAKLGNWHALPDGAKLKTAKLTRRKNGNGWSYSISISVDGMPEPKQAGAGIVALDWGHREHGHDSAREGMRVFAWRGDDGETGEILLPVECRAELDKIDALKSRLDTTFDARKETLKLQHRNRHGYRSALRRSGVCTEEEQLWRSWETRYERRIARARKRIDNIRSETYQSAVRDLARRYAVIVLEKESTRSHRRQAKEERTKRRKRSNRELSARYAFVQLCERSGAEVLLVPSRNTTSECPSCGHLCENTAELETACPSCGLIRDKDFGACEIILRRAKEVLAKRAA